MGTPGFFAQLSISSRKYDMHYEIGPQNSNFTENRTNIVPLEDKRLRFLEAPWNWEPGAGGGGNDEEGDPPVIISPETHVIIEDRTPNFPTWRPQPGDWSGNWGPGESGEPGVIETGDRERDREECREIQQNICEDRCWRNLRPCRMDCDKVLDSAPKYRPYPDPDWFRNKDAVEAWARCREQCNEREKACKDTCPRIARESCR